MPNTKRTQRLRGVWDEPRCTGTRSLTVPWQLVDRLMDVLQRRTINDAQVVRTGRKQ